MLDDHVKVTVQIDDKTITFEGPRDFVEAQLAKFMPTSASKHDESSTGNSDKERQQSIPQSERRLVQEKRPANHNETVAVLAFGLALDGKEEFTDEDIRKAYIRAGIRPPKVVAQAIRDAKNRADFIELGSKKGTFRLSPHGDRTVRFDLPRPE